MSTTDLDSPASLPAEPSTPSPAAGDAVGSNRWYLSSAPIVRALVHLCVPMAAAMIVGAVYNVINAGFIGSLHDNALLAAVTLGTPILGLVMAVGGVFGVGGGALISRLLGAAEHDPAEAAKVRNVSSFAVWGAAITGAVLGVLGLIFLGPLVALLGADAATASATATYVGVMLAFVPVLAAAFCLEQLVRAEGASREVMVGLIASTVANLLLDVVFILVLHWGVAGVALATGLSNLAVVVYFATWLTRHSEHVSLAPRWFTLSPSVLKPVFGVGVGELLQASFLIVTSLVLNNLAAAYGDGPLAAMGVAVRIAQVPEFLLMGVTLGILPLLAYSYGKGDRGRLTAAVRTAAITVGGLRRPVLRGRVRLPRPGVLRLRGRPHRADDRCHDPHRPARRDDRQRLRRTHDVAVPGDRQGRPGDRHVGVAGSAVHPRRAARQRLVRPGGRHLGAHRHRDRRVPRRRRAVARVPRGDRPRSRRGQRRARRGGAGAGELTSLRRHCDVATTCRGRRPATVGV